MFTGDKVRQTARTNIYALKICNIKFFEEYLNEFQDYYCTIGDLDNQDLIYLLFRKLPEPWRTVVKESIEFKPLDRLTVGAVAERIREIMREQCKANLRAKAAKKQLKEADNFCKKLIDIPTN